MTTLTRQVIQRVRQPGPLPAAAIAGAKHCLLDTLGVAIAGSQEPVAVATQHYAASEGVAADATIWGTSLRASRSQAAFANGTAAHALDFDDVVAAMEGHPSAPVVPALLAVAEGSSASGADLIRAFIVGFETEALIGQLMKPSHYARGFHTTATIGAFGAAAASAELLGLNQQAWENAFGIAGAHASGLKSMFGTMTKPLQVGSAAENGVKAALLAQAGVTAQLDVLGAEQGFRDTQSDGVGQLPAPVEGRYAINEVLFKYHAACYLTHSMIEGLLPMRDEGIVLDDIEVIKVQVPPGHLRVCNIEDPSAPLEGKFSLKFVAATTLVTGNLSEQAFDEQALREPRVRSLMDRVIVAPRTGPERSTIVTVRTTDGRVREADVDVNAPTPPGRLNARWDALVRKFNGIVAPVLGEQRSRELVRQVRELDTAASTDALFRLLAGSRTTERPTVAKVVG